MFRRSDHDKLVLQCEIRKCIDIPPHAWGWCSFVPSVAGDVELVAQLAYEFEADFKDIASELVSGGTSTSWRAERHGLDRD